MSTQPFHVALRELQEYGVAPVTPEEARLRRLPIAEVSLVPAVFQPRQDVTATAAHGKHLAELIRSLRAKKKADLTPITILKVNQLGWVCIDGFHRWLAYREVGGRRTHIPVKVFEGTIDEAVKVSVEKNSADKLNMTLPEKLEAAFRMVCRGCYTQGGVSAAAGISETTVDRMRKALVTLRASHPTMLWEERSWADCKHTLRNSGEGPVMWKDRRAQQAAGVLTKHLKGLAEDSPDVFMEAICIYAPEKAEIIGRGLLSFTARKQAEEAGDVDY